VNLPAFERVIAIDWSGAEDLDTQYETIWTADFDGAKTSLTYGRSREQVVAYLVDLRRTCTSLLVGMDFSFSLPAWFLRKRLPQLGEPPDIRKVWEHVAAYAEAWLAGDENFYGRKGEFARRGSHFKQDEALLYRETEKRYRQAHRPSPTFQIGGAGAVGTGSLRGMPCLLKLAGAGFSVWPFEPFSSHTVVEIYPAVFTRRSARVKGESRGRARRRFLDQEMEAAGASSPWRSLGERELTCAELSQDAFDALVSAMKMTELLRAGGGGLEAYGPEAGIEGEIWPPVGL
jgi:hypothetical protein